MEEKMELLFVIAPILIISIQEWIADMRLQRELNKIRRSLGTGEVETLGPGKMFVFDKQKVGTVTGTSLHRNEELDVAEKLIKEAKEKKV